MRFVSFCAAIIAFAFGGAVFAQPPAQQGSVPIPVDMDKAHGYQVGPGDEITVKVVGEADFDFVGRVNEDGKLDVPFDEKPLDARCKTERELRSEMKVVLARYLRNPQFNLRVTEQNSRPPVTIYGEVNNPQPVKLLRKASLVELLATSGGVKEEAGGMVQVFRTQTPICTDGDADANWTGVAGDPTDVPSRLFTLTDIRANKPEANPIIYPGDVIIVQKASPVYITGEVGASQGLYLKEGGTTLTEAIAKVGGVREGAKKDIKIYRLKPNSKEREIIAANLTMIKSGQQKDPLLQPYDIIEVDKTKDSMGLAILKFAIGAAKTTATTMVTSGGTRILY